MAPNLSKFFSLSTNHRKQDYLRVLPTECPPPYAVRGPGLHPFHINKPKYIPTLYVW